MNLITIAIIIIVLVLIYNMTNTHRQDYYSSDIGVGPNVQNGHNVSAYRMQYDTPVHKQEHHPEGHRKPGHHYHQEGNQEGHHTYQCDCNESDCQHGPTFSSPDNDSQFATVDGSDANNPNDLYAVEA